MSAKKPFRPETQAIHSGQQLDPATFRVPYLFIKQAHLDLKIRSMLLLYLI